MIYLDSAATSLEKYDAVIKEMNDVLLSKSFANPQRGSYGPSQNASRKMLEIRQTIASYFGLSNPLNVVLTPNVTYSLNYIIKSIFNSGDHIITSLSEHNSVLRPLYQFEEMGGELSFLDIDDDFNIKISDLDKMLKKNTKAVVITAASNVTGKITDLKRINDFTRENNLKLVIDGAQLAGVKDFKLNDFDEVIFAFTGHKSLHGPDGTGGFLIKGDFDFKEVFSGGSGFDSYNKSQPHRLPDLFEVGTGNLVSFAGLAAGIKEIEKNPPYKKLNSLRKKLFDGLSQNEKVELFSSNKGENAPIVSFRIKGFDSNEIERLLWEDYEICSRSGAHCAPLFHKRMGTDKTSLVRFSLSYFNDEDEVEKAINAIKELSK